MFSFYIQQKGLLQSCLLKISYHTSLQEL